MAAARPRPKWRNPVCGRRDAFPKMERERENVHHSLSPPTRTTRANYTRAGAKPGREAAVVIATTREPESGRSL